MYNVHDQLVINCNDSHRPQWRVQKFVSGLKGIFFLLFNFLRGGGPGQKVAEKMIFPTKKVAKYYNIGGTA